MRSLLLVMITAVLAGPCHASHDVEWCMTRYSDQIRHHSPTGAGSTIVAPFQIMCLGHLHAALDVTGSRTTLVRLQLEQQQNGQWTTVAQGQHIDFQAKPGTWRIRLVHSGSPGAFFNWTLRYSIPRP